jgi:hypothetical protein
MANGLARNRHMVGRPDNTTRLASLSTHNQPDCSLPDHVRKGEDARSGARRTAPKMGDRAIEQAGRTSASLSLTG